MAKKLWQKVEDKVCDILGLRKIKFSGGMWPNKEDGEDDYNLIMQAKASNKQVSIHKDAVNDLVKRSLIQNKYPIFAFHIEDVDYDYGQTWVAIPIDEFEKIKEEFIDA